MKFCSKVKMQRFVKIFPSENNPLYSMFIMIRQNTITCVSYNVRIHMPMYNIMNQNVPYQNTKDPRSLG